MEMFNKKYLIILFFSFLFSQEFDPKTGELVKKKFNPKTGELLNLKSNPKSEIILKDSVKTEDMIENRALDHKMNSLAQSNFNKIYFEETMYLQSGFLSTVFEKNGRKISKSKAYKEFEKYGESRNLYDQARLRLVYSAISAGLVVASPFLGGSTNNFMVFFTAYLGGFFTLTYNTVAYSNMIRKAVWIFNKEALKSNMKNELK